jgi:hypothetical protein
VVLPFYSRASLHGTLSTLYLHDLHNDVTALQAVRLQVRFPKVSLGIFIDLILPAVLWLWGRRSL